MRSGARATGAAAILAGAIVGFSGVAFAADHAADVATLKKLSDAWDAAIVRKDEKAIADFEEEARRAAVPPGWLR